MRDRHPTHGHDHSHGVSDKWIRSHVRSGLEKRGWAGKKTAARYDQKSSYAAHRDKGKTPRPGTKSMSHKWAVAAGAARNSRRAKG